MHDVVAGRGRVGEQDARRARAGVSPDRVPHHQGTTGPDPVGGIARDKIAAPGRQVGVADHDISTGVNADAVAIDPVGLDRGGGPRVRDEDPGAGVVVREAVADAVDAGQDADAIATIASGGEEVDLRSDRVGFQQEAVAGVVERSETVAPEVCAAIPDPQPGPGSGEREIAKGDIVGVVELNVGGPRGGVGPIQLGERGRIGGAGDRHPLVVPQGDVATEDHVADVDVTAGVDPDLIPGAQIVGPEHGEQVGLRVTRALARGPVVARDSCPLIADDRAVVDVVERAVGGDGERLAGTVGEGGVADRADLDAVAAGERPGQA